jgi:hypothetical protein
MAELRVTNIEPTLMAQLKSGAALAQVTLRDYVVKLLSDGIKLKGRR